VISSPVVFGGINHYTPDTSRGQTNVTGSPSPPTWLAVDYQQMQRFHLSLSALSEGTEVFYRPASCFEMHRAQIIAVGW